MTNWDSTIEKLLRGKKSTPVTMRALARHMRVSFTTAQRRLESARRNLLIYQTPVREGERGPLSLGYYMRSTAPSSR